MCLLFCYFSLEEALAPLSPGRSRKKLTSVFRKALLQPAQGLPVKSIFYNSDVFAMYNKTSQNRFKLVSKWYIRNNHHRSCCKEPQFVNFIMICAYEFVWWDLKGKKHVYWIFLLSDLENTFYSEIEKKPCLIPMSRSHTNTKWNSPVFTRFWEMTCFPIVQHNFPFPRSICMELFIFSETRLEIRQWMILFLQNTDVRTLYTQIKEV